MLVALCAAGSLPAALSADVAAHRPEDLSLLHQGELVVGEGYLRTEIAATGSGRLYFAGTTGPSDQRSIEIRSVDAELSGSAVLTSIPAPWFGAEPLFRTLCVGEELVVLYQSLGPEGEALNLVRLDKEGRQVHRAVIRAFGPGADGLPSESLSGFCAAWTGREILVCTAGPGNRLMLRSVTLQGAVIEERGLEGFFEGAFEAGLALGFTADTKWVYYSARDGESWVLKAAELDRGYHPVAVYQFENDDRQQKMPSGLLEHEGLQFLSYLSTPRALETERTDAYLQVMDPSMEVWADFRVGENSQLPARPTLARVGDDIYVSWLEAAAEPGASARARVERYRFSLASPEDRGEVDLAGA